MVDYSKFNNIEDSDEEPIWQTEAPALGSEDHVVSMMTTPDPGMEDLLASHGYEALIVAAPVEGMNPRGALAGLAFQTRCSGLSAQFLGCVGS